MEAVIDRPGCAFGIVQRPDRACIQEQAALQAILVRNPQGELRLEPGHGGIVAAQGILVDRRQVARTDAIGLEPADLAIAEIAVRHAAVVLDHVQRGCLERGAQRHLFIRNPAFDGRQSGGGD